MSGENQSLPSAGCHRNPHGFPHHPAEDSVPSRQFHFESVFPFEKIVTLRLSGFWGEGQFLFVIIKLTDKHRRFRNPDMLKSC